MRHPLVSGSAHATPGAYHTGGTRLPNQVAASGMPFAPDSIMLLTLRPLVHAGRVTRVTVAVTSALALLFQCTACAPSRGGDCKGGGCEPRDSGASTDGSVGKDADTVQDASKSDSSMDGGSADAGAGTDSSSGFFDAAQNDAAVDSGDNCHPDCDPTTKSCGDADGCGSVCIIQDCAQAGFSCRRILFTEPIARCQCRGSCDGASCGEDNGCGTPCVGTCPASDPVCWPTATTLSCCQRVGLEIVCE